MMDTDGNVTTAARIASSIGERIISGALPPDAPLRQGRRNGNGHPEFSAMCVGRVANRPVKQIRLAGRVRQHSITRNTNDQYLG
jgi:hypothetical protein